MNTESFIQHHLKENITYFNYHSITHNALKGSFIASTLFVDIKGFTPLTERLLHHGTEGAEWVSKILDTIFGHLVTHVAANNGIIPHFAGDAFTAIFIEDSGAAVLNTAWAIKHYFDSNSVFVTPFGNFDINVRLGLSYGIVEWGIIDKKQHAFYFKGAAIERATLAQKHAPTGQIVYDSWLNEPISHFNIDSRIISKAHKVLEKLSGYPLSKDPTYLTKVESEYAIPFSLTKNTEKNILTPAKGEFRNVIALFISFTNAFEFKELETIGQIVLSEFKNFGGHFKEIDFSEREGVIVGFFGAPISYENNAHRALECALAIKNTVNNLHSSCQYHMRMGLTSGVAYTGMIGSTLRNQYAAVGDRVNLAARLMQNAEWGEILTDNTLAHNLSFEFEKKGNLIYKGISKEIETFVLIKKHQDDKVFFTGELVGRNGELEKLCSFTSKAIEQQRSTIIFINGEAGIGKSRLTYELRQFLEVHTNMQWIHCPVDQILKKSFNPFIHYLKQYFNQSSDVTLDINAQSFYHRFDELVKQLSSDEEYLSILKTELVRTQSILAALLGISYEDSLWEQLDAKGRYENTLSALENLFLALAQLKPLVLEIEDAHWLDSDSLTFINSFVKKIANSPIIILFTSRYDDEGNTIKVLEKDVLAENNIPHIEIELKSFSQKDLKVFAENRLNGKIHADLLKTLWRTTNGNPFYAEQILGYFIENNLLECLTPDSSIPNIQEWNIKDKKIHISNSISGIMTARIDRLSHILKETVKTAAVIGREFELPILSEVMLAHEEYIRSNGNSKLVLQEQVETAEKGQIWQAMNELRYIFRHSLLREAIYDMQLKTRLRELHAMIAKAIEKIYANQLEERYIDLAFHYEQAQNIPKTNEYLKKAGDHAKRLFQNQNALDLYDRLLNNLDNNREKIKILLKKGEILQLIGDWKQSEICFSEAVILSESLDETLLKGRSQNALGQVLMLKGDYIKAKEYFEKATSNFNQLIDLKGIIKANGNLGNLYFRQGEYEKAKQYYKNSIQMNRKNNIYKNAQIVSHLGLTYMNQGNYTEGVRCQEEELKRCESQNDLTGMSILYINMGIILSEQGDNDKALNYLEKGLELAQKLGNKQSVAIALGCIGNLWLQKSDFEKAKDYLQEDFKMTEELGDKQGIAIACELQARWHSAKGEFDEGLIFFTKSLVLCRELNYQKGIAKALQGTAEINAFNCDYLDALKHLDEAIAIAQKTKNSAILCYCLTDKGNILLKLGDYLGAKTLQKELEMSINFSENKRLFNYCKHFLNKI